MREIVRTNDPALISFVVALFKDAGFAHFVADAHVSAVEGSIGAFQRRILVDDAVEDAARRLLADAGVGDELRRKK